MVIYYGRDPQGRRVEVQVSKQQHKQIQASGGWRQSGAKAQVQQQIREQYQASVAKEQVRIEKLKEEAIRAGKTVIERPSGEVVITTPKTGKVITAAVAAATPRITAPKIEPRPELLREREPTPPRIMEPPEMPPVHVTAPVPFTMYEARPKPAIKMGPPREWVRGEGRIPTTEELSILGPELEIYPPPKKAVPMRETISEPFLIAREKAAKESPDIFGEWIELAAPLIPVKTEREIAYPSARVGIEPIIGFGLGAAYGVVTFVPSIAKLPEAVYGVITKPEEAIKGITEEFVTQPTFAIGKILGGVITGFGIGKLVGWGITKFRPSKAVAEARITPARPAITRMRYDIEADLLRGTKFIKGKGVAKVYYGIGKAEQAYARITMDIKTSLKKLYPTKVETTIIKLGKGITKHEILTAKTGYIETITGKGITYIKKGFRYEHPEILGKPYQVTLAGKPAAMQTVIKGLTGEKLYFQKLIAGKEFTLKITAGRGIGLYEVTPQYMARTAAQYRTMLSEVTRVAYKGKRIKIQKIGVGVAERAKFKPVSLEQSLKQMGIGKFGPAAKVVTRTGKAWQQQARTLAAIEQSMKLAAETVIKPPVVTPVSAAASARAALYATGKFAVPTVTKVARVAPRAAPLATTVSQVAGIGRVERVAEEKAAYPARLETAFPDLAMRTSPWARARMKPMLEEEEVYVSRRARKVVGVQALATRQRVITMQRFGLGEQQAQVTLSQLGIMQAPMVKPALGIGVVTGLGLTQKQIQSQFQKQAQQQRQISKQAQEQAIGFQVPVVPIVPPFMPFAAIPTERKKKVPRKRKPRVKPAYKYREIKHPFPSIRELMGV